jgi:hypothetical protein
MEEFQSRAFIYAIIDIYARLVRIIDIYARCASRNSITYSEWKRFLIVWPAGMERKKRIYRILFENGFLPVNPFLQMADYMCFTRKTDIKLI